MGISFSNNRRRNNHHHHHPNPYYHNPPPPPQPQPQTHYYSDSQPDPTFATSSSSSYPDPNSALIPYVGPRPAQYQQPYPLPPPPPPQTHYCHGGQFNSFNNPMMGRLSYNQNYQQQYHANQNGWHPAMRGPMAVGPAPYVEHQNAKKVKNDVNVHKGTLKVDVDEDNPDHHLVSFVFDALYDGSITILYFAKEEVDCKFVPLFPEAFTQVVVPFQKGVGQKFRQPSGTGIDLGFFELDDLSKPSPAEDVFPLVISAKTCSPPDSADHIGEPVLDTSPHMQITQAVLEKNNDGPFQVKVIKQILWIDEVRYELREIYGIATSAVEGFDDNDPGKECVICMTEPKDTAVLPCRHMCMCSDCAKELRIQSNKCPICRQPIEELIEIKMNKS